MRVSLIMLLALGPTAAFAVPPGIIYPPPSALPPRAERPIVAPPAAWVLPATIPPVAPANVAVAVSVLLLDQQAHLTREGDARYVETAIRIGASQGLEAAPLALAWDPSLETLVIHHYRLLRNGKAIDLLGNGSKLTVVRRETNLELATLDGQLTATLQPEDVRVGDVVDLAYTQTRRDPALMGRSQLGFAVAPGLAIGRMRMRALWPAGKPVQWRATAGDVHPAVHIAGGERELLADISGITTARPPKGAPGRYELVNSVQVADMGSWADVSRLMAPLYVRAAVLGPGSPLKAEAARIAAQSSDPKARVLAALELVQGQVRYLLLSMDDGGYVPAQADLTWSRRFGDCKGKTVMLLALLNELGIEARPALVSTVLGDALDKRLPMAGLFDHVLVQAKIGGRTYWLDGTRPGDRDLDRIRTPQFHWALPVSADGAELVKLVPDPLTGPEVRYTLTLDARKGLDTPAPVTGEISMTGDTALLTSIGFGQLPPAQRDRALRDYWHGACEFITPGTVAMSEDRAAGVVRLTMSGTAKMDWTKQETVRFYEVDGAVLGLKMDIAREPGPDHDAPFAVAFPTWQEWRETITLPASGKGFSLQGEDIDRTIGPYAYHRTTKLAGGTVIMSASSRTLGDEIAFADAAHLQTELGELADKGVYVKAREEYLASVANPSTADGLYAIGSAAFNRNDLTGAATSLQSAIKQRPADARAHGLLAVTLAWQGDARAEAEAARAISLDPKLATPWNARAVAAMKAGRHADVVAMTTKSSELAPSESWPLLMRAQSRSQLGQRAAALADLDAAIALGANEVANRPLRIGLLSNAGRGAEALALQDKIIAERPNDVEARRVRGMLLFGLGRGSEARADLDAAIAKKPTAEGLVDRSQLWTPNERDKRAADLALALKLNPKSASVRKMLALDAATAGRFDEAVAQLATAARLDPKDEQVEQIRLRNLRLRALAERKAGKSGPAEAALAAALAAHPDDLRMVVTRLDWLRESKRGNEALALADQLVRREPTNARWLNERCWTKATLGIATQSAVADCDAALKLSPATPNYLDSRGLAKFRLGEFEDALADYDAALTLSPGMAASLYGRGLTRARLGLAKSAAADFAAARQADAGIDAEFAGYGLAAPDASATASLDAVRPVAQLHAPAAAPM